jgi:hypothetical protein
VITLSSTYSAGYYRNRYYKRYGYID